MAGIYIHIPFCKQACHYCDFHFSTNKSKRTQIIHAIQKELTLQRRYMDGEIITTIYFGGGTPSLLSATELNDILQVVYNNFQITPLPEITLEANPDDLTFEKLSGFKSIGINRLSIGIQSFDNEILKFLNRPHDASLAIETFNTARSLGFNNISIDLMYAIPGQSFEAWRKNIALAIQLNPEHISSYSLTIEEKTVFGKWAAQKKIAVTDNDVSATELLYLIDELEKFGFQHYEVSNFSKPGFISRHNSSYWRGEKYLGVGPSAHSYNGLSRQFNVNNNHLYLSSLDLETIPATIEVLTREEKINDWLLTTLRTSWGTDLEKMRQEFGFDLLTVHGEYVQSLVSGHLAQIDDKSLILTKSGRLLADKIASDLFQ